MFKATYSRVPRPREGAKGPATSAAPQAKKHRNKPLCRTSEYMPPGSDKVGLTNSNQPSKVVWELDYGLNAKQFEQLSNRFPGVAFVQVGIGCHDHPIAHTSYRVVWNNVFKSLPPGSLVADVAGNPGFNESFNKGQSTRNEPIQVDTYCQVLSTKDSIRRKTRWGPMMKDGRVRWEEMTLYDMYRNDENRDRFSHYDYFLMNHVLYYYTFAEITRLLHLNADSVLIATLHKLEGQSGSINCGEQTFVKDFVTGKVVQKNVETGEEYSHNDPAPWFNQFSYADENGAIAWTINKGCDDTYVLTITSTEQRLVPENNWLNGRVIFKSQGEVLVVTNPESAEPPPAYAVEEVVLKTSDILPGYGDDKTVKIRITHPQFYKGLKHFMVNKPRNVRTLQDLTAKAHRDAGNNHLVGSNGKVDVDPGDLTRMVACAWASGAKLDDDMIRFVTATAGSSMASLNSTLAGKSLNVTRSNVVKQVAKFALLLENVRAAKTPHMEALQVIEDLF
jgi:hypothetical protein